MRRRTLLLWVEAPARLDVSRAFSSSKQSPSVNMQTRMVLASTLGPMGWLEWALWGAVGGGAMEALDYIVAVRRWRRMPWAIASTSLTAEQGQASPVGEGQSAQNLPAPGVFAYCVAGVLRIGMGLLVAIAVGYSIPEPHLPWLFLIIGASAPLLLEKITMLVPLLQSATQQLQPAVPQTEDPPQVAPTPGPSSSPQPGSDPGPGVGPGRAVSGEGSNTPGPRTQAPDAGDRSGTRQGEE